VALKISLEISPKTKKICAFYNWVIFFELCNSLDYHLKNFTSPKWIRKSHAKGNCCPFLSKTRPHSGWKTGALKSPLLNTIKSHFNRIFSQNTDFKWYFLGAWTPLLYEVGKRIRDREIEARNEPG